MLANKFTESHKFVEGFLYEDHLRNFIFKDIQKKTGLTFDEYLNRPRYEIQLINKVIDDTDREKAKVNQDIVNNLNNEANKGKPNIPN